MKNKGEKTIFGEVAFHLYDTYGLPREVLAEVAEQGGFHVDWEGFEQQLEQQRERARAASKSKLGEITEAPAYTGGGLPDIKFVGDHNLKYSTVVLQLAIKGVLKRRLLEGDDGEVVLKETPFYGEMGGQVGDTGEILGPQGRFIVEDTIRPWFELTIHRGRVIEGYISLNDHVEAKVDVARRLDIACNHTATHLLQAALRQTLGDRVYQKGSLVEPERFRFDFSHLGQVTEAQLNEIQRQVNEWIRQNLKAEARVLPYKQAIAEGAIALFEEKYGEEVRMLEIGEPAISKELCGGTHVRSIGEIGIFLITSQSSIGTGLHRIEAVTGRAAESLIESRLTALQSIAKEVEGSLEEVPEKVKGLVSELDAERRRVLSLERELSRKIAEDLLGQAEQVSGVTVLAAEVPALTMLVLREMGDILRDRLKSAIVVLATVYNGKPNFLAMVTPDMISRGFHAGDIISQVAKVTGGGGGGKAGMAQAGGKDAAKIDEALKLVRKLIQKV
jgi:alanyl-tRNA synthetase